jgi:hypothetical protein
LEQQPMADRRYRLEGSTRSDEIETGVQAWIADSLWMLARQWQVGEFRGEDAATPIQASYEMKTAAVNLFQSFKGKDFVPIDPAAPLEAYAEQQPLNETADFWRSAEAGLHLLRMLDDLDKGEWRTRLRSDYALQAPPDVEPEASALVKLLVRRSCDGERIYQDRTSLERAFAESGSGFQTVFSTWLDWYEDRLSGAQAYECWDPERMEYRFHVGAATDSGTVVLDAKEYPGGHLDWFSFDKQSADADLIKKFDKQKPKTVIPAPVQFAGMATQRWFEFEDGTVNFADVSASAVDFARMITAAFCAGFGDDWRVIPIRVPIGSLAQVGTLTVRDSFGDTHDLKSMAANDGPDRVWRFFELKNDGEDPLLFVPSVALGRLEGKALEHVTLIRDETENLSWGIEKTYEGTLEHAVQRGKQWAFTRAELSEPGSSSTDTWQYRLLNPVPPHWIPFVPVRIAGTAQIRLRRGRMSEWELLPADKVGIRGKTLLPSPSAALLIYEEEIPASGIDVSSSYQFARDVSGRSLVWLGRRKRPAARQIPVSRQTDELQRSGENGQSKARRD